MRSRSSGFARRCLRTRPPPFERRLHQTDLNIDVLRYGIVPDWEHMASTSQYQVSGAIVGEIRLPLSLYRAQKDGCKIKPMSVDLVETRITTNPRVRSGQAVLPGTRITVISRKIVRQLDDLFPESSHVGLIGFSGKTPDNTICNFAGQNDFAIVTAGLSTKLSQAK